jgi:hypothetical protein
MTSIKAIIRKTKGGPGSGNWNHKGRPGMVGGSVPGNGSTSPAIGADGTAYIIGNSSAGIRDNGRLDIKSNIYREIRDASMNNLVDRSGLNYNDVARAIGIWTESSNDSPDALVLQQEAAQMFGTKVSDWQQEKIDSIVAKKGKLSPIDVDRSTMNKVMAAMYAETQKDLAAKGIKTVTLYRGMNSKYAAADVGKLSNAISSYTASRQVAEGYARQYGNNGSVVKSIVPASYILSTGRTGFGSLSVSEYVVISNPAIPSVVLQ